MANGEHAERIVRAETRIEDVREDIADLKEKQGENAKAAEEAHATLLQRVHNIEERVAEILTWGKILGALVTIAGIVIPLVVTLSGK